MRPVAIAILLAAAASSIAAAQPTTTKGHALVGLPALNFDADEGMGYGALLQWYEYGAEGTSPYRYTIQPTVFLTTKGRKDGSLFFDAPHLLPAGWRMSATVAREEQLATPYYGIGNETVADEAATNAANPYFYRFGRRGVRGSVTLQRDIAGPSLRLLGAAGGASVTVTPVPYGTGTTLFATELGGDAAVDTRTQFVRVGIVLDTRDHEIGPRRGTWAELLVQRAGFGGTEHFTRSTMTVRRYVPVAARVTWAERVVVQNTVGDVSRQELFTIQSSFKDDEALGGAGSLRGIPKNRYAGKGVAFANSELRWDAAHFSLKGRPSQLVLSGFVDAGRVWAESPRVSELLSDLHVSGGGGVRLAVGPSMVVAADVGHSSQSAAAVYVGLGYAF
jgi:hypothetical protein